MKDRHYGSGILMLAGLLLASAAFTRVAAAQDVDPYHAFILEHLETTYNITGGEFLLGNDSYALLDQGPYGSAVGTRMPPDVDLGHEYLHLEAPQQTNPWDSGITWPSRIPVQSGDTGLIVALIRGESNAGGSAIVNVFVERAGGDYAKFGNRDAVEVTADWNLILIPFSWPEAFEPGGTQFGLHLAAQEQYVDVTPPVVIDFRDKYTPEILQGLIDSGGQIPVLANITQDATRGVPPFTVNFDASGSSAPGEIVSWAWNFGDGSTGNGEVVSHEYTTTGRFEVVLTVTDDAGATHRDTTVIRSFNGIGLPDTPLQIPFTAEAPTVDGTVDAAWGSAPSVNIDWHVADNVPNSTDDLSGTASVLWDATYLYVLYEVVDDAYNNDSNNSWQDDAVDFYLDGLNEKGTAYDANDAQFEFSWYPADSLGSQRITGGFNGLNAGVEYSWTETANGYNIEARLPWANFETLAVPGSRIGIDFMLNDGDILGDVRDSKLSWFSMIDQAWNNPSLFATAELVGGEGQILTAHFTIGAGPYLTETPIAFDASQSVAPGSITSYAWDFGDGSTGEGATVNHTYTATGAFTVTLTITDDTGATRSVSRSINVIDGLGTPEKPLPIPLTDAVPTIDGQMENIWTRKARSVQLFNVINETVAMDDPAVDLLPTVYVMWDADNIYVFYDILDDVKVTGEASDSWRDDDAEFFLDTDNSKTPSAHDGNDAQFSIRLNDPVMTGDATGKYPSTQFATAETATGWTLEMAVPWSDVGATMSEGDLIGIEFQVNDDDTQDDRDHKVAWIGTEDNAWQWAHLFGTAVLTGPLVVGTEEESGLPERFAIESVYPNPFNPTTTALVAIRQPGEYEVKVFNVLGQLIEKKNLEVQTAGRIEIPFDFGSRASGIYLISIKNKTTGKLVTARATLVK